MREGMTGHIRDVFSKSDSGKKPEDCGPEDTMIYAPGQEEILLAEEARRKEIEDANTQFGITPQFGEDFKQFGENPTMLKTGRTIYEKANEGDVEEARHEVITKLFNNALFFDKSSVGRIKEDSVDPILAYTHLKQAKELGFPEYKQMRDEFMRAIPEALRRNKIQELPEGTDPKYKDPKKETQKYILEIEKEIVDEMDEQIEEINEDIPLAA